MERYLLIESRDPVADTGVAHTRELAAALAGSGAEVTLFLVENGVFAARHGDLAAARAAGVQVLADSFALAERGISAPTVPAADLDVVLDQLAEGRKVLWH